MPTTPFIEQIGILFAASLFVEGVVKDLIVFKVNPQFIQEINGGTISAGLTAERTRYGKYGFTTKLVDEFIEVYKLDETARKLLYGIVYVRDTFGHSRISLEEERLWHAPDSPRRLAEKKAYFGVAGEGEILTIDESNLNFNGRKQVLAYLDEEFFPPLAKSIGLDYGRIR